ncbi:transposase [Pendulispora albinea]|uniref:Transposase n=1 Tax=Pendulispora albinea TaxID=2741071 RepID=A0ABZ2M3E9_9BACT
MHRHALTDAQWRRLQRVLPKQKTGPASELGDRLFIEAVLYRAKTGLPWRDLSTFLGVPGIVALALGGIFLSSTRGAESGCLVLDADAVALGALALGFWPGFVAGAGLSLLFGVHHDSRWMHGLETTEGILQIAASTWIAWVPWSAGALAVTFSRSWSMHAMRIILQTS